MYKYISSLVFFVFTLSSALSAQMSMDDYKPENPGWLVKIEEAHALSAKTNKPILANFTGSDWCGWCKKLTASVFSKEEFAQWANENVILLEVDYPRRKTLPNEIVAQNNGLASVLEIAGYPTVWLFDIRFDQKQNQFVINPIGRTGYAASVKDFTNAVDQMIATRKPF